MSSFKFLQWVADRSYNSETMQALFQYLQTINKISSDDEQLIELEDFLKFEDEVILDFYNFDITKNQIEKNSISKIFKNFKM